MHFRLFPVVGTAWIMILFGAAVVQAGEYSIAYEAYPPYEYEEKGEAAGVNIALVREAFRRMGETPVFELMPWSRALYELKNGDTWAMSSGFKTPEREAVAYFCQEGLAWENVVVLGLAGSHVEVRSLEDLRGLKVGVRRDHSYGQTFDSMVGLEKTEADCNQQLFKMLLAGRIDAIVANKAVFSHEIKNMDRSDDVRVLMDVKKIPLHLFFSRALGDRSRDVVRRFDMAVRAMKKDGTFDAILARY